MNKIFQNRMALVVIAMIIGGLLVWLILPRGTAPSDTSAVTDAAHDHADETIWTCSMHPQIRQPEPGDCPICGMELIPLEGEESELAPDAVRMSSTAMRLADVETAVVGEGAPVKTVRLNGTVAADQRRTYSQTSHIPGRIEELRIDFTGEYVSAGQTLARVYSPALITAQNELIQAKRMKDSQPALYEAARRKLKNWKLTDAQIQKIEETDGPLENFPINADRSGYVVEKMVELGDYVERGQPLYRISDLDRVWVLFDVYESDMPWIEKGDSVKFTVASLPGKQFTGRIDYLDPVLDPKTRVAQARVDLSNPEGVLRPGMFASGRVRANLERESQGLIVPRSAVMWTGERSVVYVKRPGDDATEFVMREVVLGPSLGDAYVVDEGLATGEEIAVHGTFSIDAAAQLAGKPSMMSPADDEGSDDEVDYSQVEMTTEAKAALQPLIEAYFDLKDALVEDDLAAAKQSTEHMQRVLSDVPMSLFEGEAHRVWMDYSAPLERAVSTATEASDIQGIRHPFIEVSEQMEALVRIFHPTDQTLYVQHCPMANNDTGADWLSREEDIRNPYFGDAMLTCGEVTLTIE